MEDLYGWLIVLAGATIGLLGAFLFTSERELRNKRREYEEFRANQTADTLHRPTEAQRSETHTSAELVARNKELVDQVTSLSGRLEESQRTVDELQKVQGRFASAQAEEAQLQETITNLRNQLEAGKTQLNESDRRRQEATDLNSKLQNEAVQLQQQLQENQKTEEKLRTEQDRLLLETQTETQQLRTENRELLQEIANLRNQLQATEAQLSHFANQCEEGADRELQLQSRLGELRGQMERLTLDKQELLEQIDSLSNKLSASEKSVDELRTMEHDTQSENQELRAANQELQRQSAEMTDRLHTSETQLGELTKHSDEAAARCAQLQFEVGELRQRADEIQAKAREFEALQQQLANVESRELVFRDRQHELEAQIVDLQRELATGREKVQELVAARQQLAGAEQACEELRGQNRRLQEEIASWRDRLDGSAENQREVTQLRQQLEELRMKHAELTEKNRQWQPATHSIELSQEAIQPEVANEIAGIQVETAVSEVNSPIRDLSENNGNRAQPSWDDPASGIQGANGGAKNPAVRVFGKRKWRYGLIPAGVVLLIGGVVVGLLAVRSPGSKEPAAASETVSDEPTVPIETASIARETKPPPRLRGAFKITRPTQVYSGPSEYTALVGNIERGMKINVVDSRDGWLEIRSKHGRPPGFVRQEAAVRIDSN